MPRITEGETDQYRLWETIYFHKGEEYLNEKLKYFRDRIQEEEIALITESILPVDEYKDSNYFQNQISQYQESIRIINSIIESNSAKKRFDFRHIKKSIERIRNDYAGKIKEIFSFGNRSIINKTELASNDKDYDEVNIKQNRIKTSIRKKYKTNYFKIAAVFLSALLFSLGSHYLFGISDWFLIVGILLGMATAILAIATYDKIKSSNSRKSQLNLKMISSRLGCNYFTNFIKGYFRNHRIELVRDLKEKHIRLSIGVNTVKPLILYFTSVKSAYSKMPPLAISKDFDEKFKIYANTEDVRFAFDSGIRKRFFELLTIKKSFSFVVQNKTLSFIDNDYDLRKTEKVAFYLMLINFFSDFADKLEAI